MNTQLRLGRKQMEYTHSAYDIYVIKLSGVPIFAGCTGSDYCQAHDDKHILHSGLFTTFYFFANQSFEGSMIKTILFDDLQINFLVDEANKVMIAVNHPISVENIHIRKQLEYAHKTLIEKYHYLIESETSPNEYDFDSYKQDLVEIGLVPENLISILSKQASVGDVLHNKLKIPEITWDSDIDPTN